MWPRQLLQGQAAEAALGLCQSCWLQGGATHWWGQTHQASLQQRQLLVLVLLLLALRW